MLAYAGRAGRTKQTSTHPPPLCSHVASDPPDQLTKKPATEGKPGNQPPTSEANAPTGERPDHPETTNRTQSPNKRAAEGHAKRSPHVAANRGAQASEEPPKQPRMALAVRSRPHTSTHTHTVTSWITTFGIGGGGPQAESSTPNARSPGGVVGQRED